MGYFPLPELKGKPNRIFVDGKTLNQIAKESGIRLDTVQHRYSRGIRDYEGLTKPSHIRVEHEKTQRKTYSIMSAGERVMERIWELDIPLQTISDKTGISRSTIYAFLYNGTDLSSMRLAKLTDYPQVFYSTKPEAKNTQALLDYMNSKTSVDPNVVALYTKMDKLCDGLSDEVVLKVTHGEHRVKRSWNRNFEYVFDVGIPKINPNYIGTYDTNLHEEMHFLDMLITVKDNKDKLPSKMFSQSYKPLVEAFDKATPVIGDKAKKLFEDFAKECDIIYKKQQETFNTQHEKIKEQYRSGAIDWKKYNSLYKKLSKEVNEEADNERRALFGGGVSGLQDIYDAVSKGTFRDTGQVTYGHGSAYYTDRRRTNPNCSESLANYASLCVGHPELIDILAEDYPEIVTALRGCVEAMLKEVPK